jgi:salicylate hydroxylase
MGSGSHVLTFPVNHGKTLNIVAFFSTTDEWADYPQLTRTGTRDEALRDFAGYGNDVTELLKLVESDLSVVSDPARSHEPVRDRRETNPSPT